MSSPSSVLIVGGGGREHALAYALRRGDRRVVVTPGNAGIALDVECLPAPEGVVALAASLGVDLVVVGPEAPLVEGLADELTAAGIPVLGPSRAAAAVEGSKAFMKDLCRAAGVATADYGVFARADEASSWLAGREGGWVVKADGLCAGKGVTVCASAEEAAGEARRMLEGAFGDASARVVVEAFLPGEELSVLGLCDGEDALLFAPARDHKQLYDGGRGPNTGGMGAVAPLDERAGVTQALLARVKAEVFLPVLAELGRRGTPYRGVLYAGLMIEGLGRVDEKRERPAVRVLEFNCRFGDPEAQAVLLGTEVDLGPLFLAVGRGLPLPSDAPDLVEACAPTCAVVVAAAGYPGPPEGGRIIEQAGEPEEGAKVFYAGVKRDGARLVTAGGRVLAAAARGDDLEDAIARAYRLVDHVTFAGRQWRRDIGRSAFAIESASTAHERGT